jgi:hypothetical protein
VVGALSGLVYSTTDSGLAVAFTAADERSVRAALKAHDPDLNVDWKLHEGETCWYVTRYLGSARTDEWVCDWADEHGQPLPLSHGLVERVKQLDMNSRHLEADPEQLNDARTAAIEAEQDAEAEWYATELVKHYRGKSGVVLPRGIYRRKTAFRDIRR